MRWTKGKHAFIVATHIDKAHIHNHIIYNSTSLDASRKFNNFFLSGLAVQRLSDMVCLEHGLSIITPKPYRERPKRTIYPKKRTQRDELCDAIDVALNQKPKRFEDFIQSLADMGLNSKTVSSLRLREKSRNGLFVCVLWAKDTAKRNCKLLSPVRACVNQGRLLSKSSFICLLIFRRKWLRVKQ